MSWNGLFDAIEPYLVRIETQEGFGTGFILGYNSNRTVAAFATAAHVIDTAADWKQPMKIIHHKTGKERFLTDADRVVLIDRKRDSASIIIEGIDPDFPKDGLALFDANQYYKIGVEVGWIGFPSIVPQHLCLFTGRISAFMNDYDSYLIDGVVINGVSGGPVVIEVAKNTPQIIGSISAYMPNRVRGDVLPGLVRAQDVTSYHDAIKELKSFDEAKEKDEKQAIEARAEKPRAEKTITDGPSLFDK